MKMSWSSSTPLLAVLLHHRKSVEVLLAVIGLLVLIVAQNSYQSVHGHRGRSTTRPTTNDTDTHTDTDTAWLHPDCQAVNVTREAVAMSRTVGNIHRLQQAFRRDRHDDTSIETPTRIVVLGGSVTAGHDCYPAASKDLWNLPNLTCAWPYRLEKLLSSRRTITRTMTSPVQIVNKARGGTPSSAGVTQIMALADQADIIIIAWAANDDNYEKFYGPDPHLMRRSFETLLRTALALPQRPAVLLFEDFALRRASPVAEQMHASVANVYELPIISARAAFWNLHQHQVRSYSSPAHVPAIWHERFACLIEANLWQDIHSAADMSSYQDPLVAVATPVFGGTTLHCHPISVFSALSGTLQSAPAYVDLAWSYYADAPGKFGYIANTTGATLQFSFLAHQQQQPLDSNNNSNNNNSKYVLFVHYLRSYSSEWGRATLQINTTSPTTTTSTKQNEQYAKQPPVSESVLLDATTTARESQTVEASVEWNHTSTIRVTAAGTTTDPVVATITVIRGKMKIVEVSLFGCRDDDDDNDKSP